MANVFRVPKLGLTAEEVTVDKWLKGPGDPVRAGEPFVVLQTDKAALDVDAPQDGYLQECLRQVGDVVPIGAELAVFSTVPGDTSVQREGATFSTADPNQAAAQPAHPKSSAPTYDNHMERHRGSPAVRRRARELGLDLDGVVGTGPRGRIRMQDLNAKPNAHLAQSSADPAIGEMSRVRLATAQRMVVSAQTIPQFALRREADMEKVMSVRDLLRSSFATSGADLSLMDFLLMAAAQSLMQYPALRTHLVGELGEGRTAVCHNADIGVAVASTQGLLVPVISGVQDLSLLDIAKARRAAVDAAQGGHLPARFAGKGCFTVSNLGPYGVDAFDALINPGEAAIVAVGAVRHVPSAHEGVLALRRRMVLTFSFDHRLVDGAEGAQFAGDLVNRLEAADFRLV